MDASVMLNTKNEVAFIYGEPLGITPEWASLDVEMHQLNIFDKDSEERFLKLDKLKQEIYERIKKQEKILLVQVENNDITKPVQSLWVSLNIPTQYKN